MISKIFVVHHTHLDIGFTDLQDRVQEFHRGNMDKVISLCKRTSTWPQNSRWKWTVEVSRLAKDYIENRNVRHVKDFISLVKGGQIEIAGLYLTLCTDLAGIEELIKAVAYVRYLKYEYDVEIKSAMINDVPGYTWILPQILTKAGIKYLSVRANPYRAANLWVKASPDTFAADIKRWRAVSRPFYWKAPDGSKILVWYTDSYRDANFLRGDGNHAKDIQQTIDAYQLADYKYDAIQLRAGGDNLPADIKISETVLMWNRTRSNPELIVATNSQFFEYMENKYAHQFPELCGDITNWWSDGPASSAYETGLNRITHHKLSTAETLAGIYNLLSSGRLDVSEKLEQAYDRTMLYDEHTWGSFCTVERPYSLQTIGQWSQKAAFAHQAAVMTAEQSNLALHALQSLIQTTRDGMIMVFNPLSYLRTDVARVAIPEGYEENIQNVELLDVETKKVIACQVEPREYLPTTVNTHVICPYHVTGKYDILFIAGNVPSMGYRLYQIRINEKLRKAQHQINVHGNMLENGHYRIEIERRSKAIKSLYDKALDKDFADRKSKYGINEYIYERRLDKLKARFIVEELASEPTGTSSQCTYRRSGLKGVTCTPGKQGPVCSSIIIKGMDEAKNNIVQEITIYEQLKKVDITNTVRKRNELKPESMYFAFPFDLKNPEILVDIPGTLMKPEADQIKGSARDYYSIQNGVSMSDRRCGIHLASIEAPLIQFGDIQTGKYLDRLNVKNATAFSWIMNNYWPVNWRSCQEGELCFRYQICTFHKMNRKDMMRIGASFNKPLEGVVLSKNPHGRMNHKAWSFCRVDVRNVMVINVSRAISEDAYIIHLQEIAGRPALVNICFPSFKVKCAQSTTLNEDTICILKHTKNTVRLHMGACELATLKLRLSAPVAAIPQR